MTISFASLVLVSGLAVPEIGSPAGSELSLDGADAEISAFNILAGAELVASGYFPRLATPDTDPYSPKYVVRRFEIIDMYAGPADAEYLYLRINSELFRFPGSEMSTYQMHQASHERNDLLFAQKRDAENALASGLLTNGIRSRYKRWLKLTEEQLARIAEERPELSQLRRLKAAGIEHFYDLGPVVEGVKYLIILGPGDYRSYPFPTWVNNDVFWGDAADEMDERFRGVLTSETLTWQLRRDDLDYEYMIP